MKYKEERRSLVSEDRIRLYRASDHGILRQGESLSPQLYTVESGGRLWSLMVKLKDFLDLTRAPDDIGAALEAAGMADDAEYVDWVRSRGYRSVGILLAEEPQVARALRRSYKWVVFGHDYLDGGVTWWYLGARPLRMRPLRMRPLR